jgi:hypothetical protein
MARRGTAARSMSSRTSAAIAPVRLAGRPHARARSTVRARTLVMPAGAPPPCRGLSAKDGSTTMTSRLG